VLIPLWDYTLLSDCCGTVCVPCLHNVAIFATNLAICHSKIAETLQKDGDEVGYQEQLRLAHIRANAGRTLGVVYRKAHTVYLQVLAKLKRKELLKTHKETVDTYDKYFQLLAPGRHHGVVGIAAVGAGLIDSITYADAFELPLIRDAFARLSRIASNSGHFRFTAKASMVPYAGAQCLSISFHFDQEVCMKEWHVYFHFCDPENQDDLELPPHGRISPMGLESALNVLSSLFLRTRHPDNDFELTTMVLGQGFHEHTDKVRGLPHACPEVVNSMSTHAYDRAMFGELGLDPNMMDFDGPMPPGCPTM
jgi:hypothetical protein